MRNYRLSTPILALATVCALCSVGCGEAASSAARTAINTTAKALVAVDKAYAPHYERAWIAARKSSSSWEERDKKMESWDAAASAIIASEHWLITAEALIDTWDQCGLTGQCDFFTTLGCLVVSIDSLCGSLEVLGIPIPQQVPASTKLLRSLLPAGHAQCQEISEVTGG